MSKIVKLIAQLCPQGVQHKELGEVANYARKRISAGELNNDNYVGVDNLLPNKRGKKSSNHVPTTGKMTRFETGDVLLGNIRPYLKKVWLATLTGGTNGDVLVIQISRKVSLHSKFLHYLLSSDDFFSYNMRFAKGAKMPRGNKAAILKYIIPIPPLAIQEEIVEILDNFTVLEARLEGELEAELGARKKQREHYQEKLFNIDDVEHKALGEIGTFVRGKRFVKSDLVSEGIPCIHYGEMYTHYKIWARESKSFLAPELAAGLRVAHPGDVIIVAAGETVEDIGNGVAWLGKSDVVIHDACYIFAHNLDPKYVSYFLRTNNFHSQIERYISSGKISSINATGLKKAIIPVPPIKVQREIVGLLDKLENLVSDISPSFPAEITARRKQYEYYCKQLLTFKEYAER